MNNNNVTFYLSGLYAPAPRHPLPNMAGVMNPMSMHSASPHPRPPMMNPAVQMPPNPVAASVNNWPANTPTPMQPIPQAQGNPPVNVVVTSSVRIPTSVGKKHALKIYDLFIRNTSCFCTMCDCHKNTFFAISKMAKNLFLHQKKV